MTLSNPAIHWLVDGNMQYSLFVTFDTITWVREAYPIRMDARTPGNNAKNRELRFRFEIDRESDGRWIAEIPEIPGAMAYGTTVEEAKAKAYSLALCAIADDIEHSKDIPDTISVLHVPA